MKTLYIDGSCRIYPGSHGGKSGAAVVTKQFGEYAVATKALRSTTNNMAEYEALRLALKIIGETTAPSLNKETKEVNIFLDSDLVYYQMAGEYQIKQKHLEQINAKCLKLLHGLAIKGIHVKLKLLSSADNRKADLWAKRTSKNQINYRTIVKGAELDNWDG